MYLNYFTESALTDIITNISPNINKYSSESAWTEDYFKEKPNWFKTSKIYMPTTNLKLSDDKSKSYDYENAVSLYTNLSLTPGQALDERLWAYLTHVNFWGYTQDRWGKSEGNNSVNRVRNRYFLGSGSSKFSRNSLGRLWWSAHLTHSEEFENKFCLTEILFKSQDIHQGLIERNFSHNTNTLKSILTALKELNEEVSDSGSKVLSSSFVQKVNKKINAAGGVSILDYWDYEDFKSLVYREYELTNSSKEYTLV